MTLHKRPAEELPDDQRRTLTWQQAQQQDDQLYLPQQQAQQQARQPQALQLLAWRQRQQQQQQQQSEQARQALQLQRVQRLQADLGLPAPLAALGQFSKPDQLFWSGPSEQQLCQPDEFDKALAAGPAEAAAMLLSHLQLSPPFIPPGRAPPAALPVPARWRGALCHVPAQRGSTQVGRGGAGMGGGFGVASWRCCEPEGGMGSREPWVAVGGMRSLIHIAGAAQRTCFTCCRSPPFPLPPTPPTTRCSCWPFGTEVIGLLSGAGGTALTLPPSSTMAPGSERAVVMADLLRPLLTGYLVGPPVGPVRLPGASAAEPGAEAGELRIKSFSGSVTWMTQVCGAPWGSAVCLPLFLMAAAAGSCPAHPRAQRTRVPFSIGRLGRLMPVLSGATLGQSWVSPLPSEAEWQ